MAKLPLPAVGIDLGTNYLSVGVWREGRVEVLNNDFGYPMTPSVVTFGPKERLIGDAALNLAISNVRNMVVGVKRLIGHKFNEDRLQNDLKTWMFKVDDQDDYDQPNIVVEYKHEVQKYRSEEIMAMLLTKLKQTAGNFLKRNVVEAVFTIPPSFNDSQRQAIIDAASIAGINVRQLLNETTAAAVLYGFNKTFYDKPINLLVADFGAGSFNVSIIKVSNENHFEVKSHSGDPHLGGEDFTTQLMEFCIADFKKTKGKNLRDSAKALYRLRVAAERVKCILSKKTSSQIDVDALYDGEDYVCNISRARFEELCFDLFRKFPPIFENAFKDAKLRVDDIDDVVLTGSSSWIPKYQIIVRKVLNGKFSNLSVYPMETVVQGVTIAAGLMINDSSHRLYDYKIQEIAYYPLGIDTRTRDFMMIFEKGTMLPYSFKKIFTTVIDDQSGITIEVYEGNQILPHDENLLGTFDLCLNRGLPKGTPEIEVTFSVGLNGILSVSAVETKRGVSSNICIKEDRGHLTPKEIHRMRLKAEKMERQDVVQNALHGSKHKLESYINNLRQAIAQSGHKMTVRDRKLIKIESENLLHWMEKNGGHAEKDDFDARFLEISYKCGPIIAKCSHFNLMAEEDFENDL